MDGVTDLLRAPRRAREASLATRRPGLRSTVLHLAGWALVWWVTAATYLPAAAGVALVVVGVAASVPVVLAGRRLDGSIEAQRLRPYLRTSVVLCVAEVALLAALYTLAPGTILGPWIAPVAAVFVGLCLLPFAGWIRWPGYRTLAVAICAVGVVLAEAVLAGAPGVIVDVAGALVPAAALWFGALCAATVPTR